MSRVPVYFVYVLLYCCTVWWSCDGDSFTQVVDVEIPPHTPLFAVTCEIVEGDSIIEVLVSHSQSILDPSDFGIIENAVITVSGDNTVLYNPGFDSDTRTYRTVLTSPLTFDERMYRLDISAPEFEPAFAVQIVPAAVEIGEIRFDRNGVLLPDGVRAHKVDVIWDDPANEENYYSVEVYTYTNIFGYDDLEMQYLQSIDPTIEYDENGSPLIDDTTFDGDRYIARLAFVGDNEAFLVPGGRLYVFLISMTRDAYLYARSLELYELSRDNPFVEPVIVHSNIENGYGVFSLRRVRSAFLEF